MGLPRFTVQRLTMRVSVVTVCFNASETIEDTLASVAAQTHPDVEHIIIDGGSTDDTLAIVARFPHVERVVSEPDKGLYDAMNKGAALATGEFVGWLSADDMFATPDSLSLVAESARPDVDVVSASVQMVDAADTNRVLRNYSTDGFTLGWLRYGYAVPHPGFYIRTAVLSRIGGFDLSYPLAADFDLIARALYRERVPFVLLSDVIVRMRMGGRSFGPKALLKMLGEVQSACGKNGISTNIVIMLYRYVHKAMQYIKRQDGAVAK